MEGQCYLQVKLFGILNDVFEAGDDVGSKELLLEKRSVERKQYN